MIGACNNSHEVLWHVYCKVSLEEIRLIKGYTIRELASRSGITREWIERIEKQDSPNLRTTTICKLATALSVHPEELITYEWITNK